MDNNVSQPHGEDPKAGNQPIKGSEPHDENEPIGEAHPIYLAQGGEDAELFALRGWPGILERVCRTATAFLTLGGITFAFLLVGTRTQGANRSARLVWEKRQAEICEAIQDEEKRHGIASISNDQQANRRSEP
jgi:hypothetical protein